MSQRDVEIVRRVIGGFGGEPSADTATLVHPDIEYDVRVRPGGKVWHGREGVQQAMQEWTAGWTDWELGVERILDAGDGHVVVMWREHGRAKGSGAEMTQEGATVVTVRDGKVVSVVVEVDRKQALSAVGLAEDT
jgi:ketosteroid isomerase-like protein